MKCLPIYSVSSSCVYAALFYEINWTGLIHGVVSLFEDFASMQPALPPTAVPQTSI